MLLNGCSKHSGKGSSIKYVTLFLANRSPPPPPCHTLSPIPGPPESTSHISDTPRFLVGLVQKTNLDKSPLYKFSLNYSRGFLCRRFCQRVFCLEGFVWGGFCSLPLLSEYELQHKVKHHFKFHVSYV